MPNRSAIVTLLSGLLSTLCLVSGCNPQQESTKPKVAFVTNQIADFWQIAKAGCLDAEKDFDVDVDVRMPSQATAVEQQSVVDDLLNSGVKGIAISPLDADNQTAWLNSVAEKVPLITHDSDAPASDRLMYIGMDNYKAGRMCGELVRQALPQGGKIMLFIGRMEQDNSKARRQGVIDELLGRPVDSRGNDPVDEEISGNGYTILGTLTDGGESSRCKELVEDTLSKNDAIDGMVGLFEYNPPAIYDALKQAGKLGKVQLIGFDENDVTLQAIKDGDCVGTVVQDPYQYGYKSVEILASLIKGDQSVIPERKFIDVPARKITRENVDEFWADLRQKKGG